MSGKADEVVYDKALDVYRVRTGAGVIVGTELGGLPLAFDTATAAEQHIGLRQERATERAEFLRKRHRWGFQ